jgi:hypothetical protein
MAASLHLPQAFTRLERIIHQAASERRRLFALLCSNRNHRRHRNSIALLAGVGSRDYWNGGGSQKL